MPILIPFSILSHDLIDLGDLLPAYYSVTFNSQHLNNQFELYNETLHSLRGMNSQIENLFLPKTDKKSNNNNNNTNDKNNNNNQKQNSNTNSNPSRGRKRNSLFSALHLIDSLQKVQNRAIQEYYSLRNTPTVM